MSFLHTALDLNIREGRKDIQRAYELAPNDSSIVSARAVHEMIRGNFDRAIHLAQKSIELDPLNPSARLELGRILAIAGRLDEARTPILEAMDASPDMAAAHNRLSIIALCQGNFHEALREAQFEKSAGFRHHLQAMAHFSLGDREASDREMTALIAEGESWSCQIACASAWRGEIDKAFYWLDRALATHDAGIPLSKVIPFLRPLHADPRWLPFLKKIGLDD